MPIARTTRPGVIVAGYVAALFERRTKEDRRLFAHQVTIQQDTGAQLAVDVFLDRDSQQLPPDLAAVGLPRVGEPFAVLAEVTESSYGASLNYARLVTVDDLDRIGSGLLTSAKA